MIYLEIEGLPISWKAHGGYGRKSFNPRFKEKEYYQWQIRSQFNQEKPYAGPVELYVVYHMPIPTGTSKVKRRQMLDGRIHHIKRCDLDNLNKFLCDCIKTILIDDDSQIFFLESCKIYSEHPKTIVRLYPVT